MENDDFVGSYLPEEGSDFQLSDSDFDWTKSKSKKVGGTLTENDFSDGIYNFLKKFKIINNFSYPAKDKDFNQIWNQKLRSVNIAITEV